MKKTALRPETGSTLVVTLSVVTTILVLLASAVSYTQHISRISQRSRKTALAMEIADGHLEYLFTNWRNVSRIAVTQQIKKKISVANIALPTQYFFTDSYNPGPAPVPGPSVGLTAAPPIIPLPAKSLFPTESNYTVAQYRIQAVDPMTTLDANENALLNGIVDPTATPPAAFGPNTDTTNGQYSFYYLASVDVQVPAIGASSGYVTAKVRRIFEKKYDEPFTFAMFYMDDLELQPATTLTITGPVHTNGSLYIGTQNFAEPTPSTSYPTSGRVTYSTSYVNGASPNDPNHTSFTGPTLPSNEPPMMQSAYLPFGWNPNLTGSSASNADYHSLIEPFPKWTFPNAVARTAATNYLATDINKVAYDSDTGLYWTLTANNPAIWLPTTAPSDVLQTVRFSNQADYMVLIEPDSLGVRTNEVVHVYQQAAPSATPQEITNGPTYNAITNAITTSKQQNQTIQDNREGGTVRLTTVDITSISKNVNKGNGLPIGMIYISDMNASASSKRGIRLIGQYIQPGTGLSVVSENPVYIQGDFNTGATGTFGIGVPANPTATPPSNAGGAASTASPLVSGYTWKPAAIVADAITLLSNNWSDAQSANQPRPGAKHTTVNAALVTGNVPSNGTNYSGGGENFVRLLEDWSSARFTYYGSMVQLWQSEQATGPWTGSATVYTGPSAYRWFYDVHFAGNPSNPAGNTHPIPPGNFQLAAYLQQQRWYQVY
ncbi:MAG: hypothetical protein ACJ8IQ_03595 [Chthoniobacterales bacterium]